MVTFTYNDFCLKILNLPWEIRWMQLPMSNMTSYYYSLPSKIISAFQTIRNILYG